MQSALSSITKALCICCYQQSLVLLSKEPCTLSKEPYIPSKEPCHLSQQPFSIYIYICCDQQSPVFSSKEPCIESKEPYIYQKSPTFYKKSPMYMSLSKELDSLSYPSSQPSPPFCLLWQCAYGEHPYKTLGTHCVAVCCTALQCVAVCCSGRVST